MTDLITEARELCELRRKQKHIPMSMLDKMLELCDALEKAEKRISLLEGAIDRQNNTIAYLNSTKGFNW